MPLAVWQTVLFMIVGAAALFAHSVLMWSSFWYLTTQINVQDEMDQFYGFHNGLVSHLPTFTFGTIWWTQFTQKDQRVGKL
jgi:hypothetical protein